MTTRTPGYISPREDADTLIARARAAITALREANLVLTRERERLQAANEALIEQVRVLQQCNATLARGEGTDGRT